ncbi:MAG: carboxypeptidase regulatory-like domain-containing protein [Candidatus Brocadia sp.]
MRKLIGLMVLCLFVCGVAKATIAGDICGYVYDTNDKGLPGVKISSKDNDKVYSEKTTASGSYYLSLSVGSYTLTYEKEGYQTQTSDVTLLKNEKKIFRDGYYGRKPNSD